MKIVLNHNPEEFPGDSLTIRQILDHKGWSFPLIIARVNGVLVDRKDWATTSVRDGAEVDLHHLVSGG
ncbi:MAG: sulfur carrier protein ThiS [Treponema sp.]|nr:sulfur carrier protein ThiS [Treponema sp.]